VSESASYVGRFAPSPTGPLHFGSLLAAVSSYLQARCANGKWLLRIENIDLPREQIGADTEIITALHAFGFEWDDSATYQNNFNARHEAIIAGLLSTGTAYECACSRRDLADAKRGPLGAIYPGTCRQGQSAADFAIRMQTNNDPIEFVDELQGPQSQRLESESGDFIIKRRDGLIAYHLAVVADDFDQGITEIVRGIDLLDSTARHIHLQRILNFSTPTYAHIPVVANRDGQKLSKLTGAPAINADGAVPTLLAALEALYQGPPKSLANGNLHNIWEWAIENWDISRLRSVESIPAEPLGYGSGAPR
jgi:glutamyl-Q tRNA(Asp) synthetase